MTTNERGLGEHEQGLSEAILDYVVNNVDGISGYSISPEGEAWNLKLYLEDWDLNLERHTITFRAEAALDLAISAIRLLDSRKAIVSGAVTGGVWYDDREEQEVVTDDSEQVVSDAHGEGGDIQPVGLRRDREDPEAA